VTCSGGPSSKVKRIRHHSVHVRFSGSVVDFRWTGEKRVKPCDSQREDILCSNILSSEPDVTDMMEAITDNETYMLIFRSFAVLARQFHSTQMCFERDISLTLNFIMPPATKVGD